ncbi:hypothetical protein N2152v2_004327 [Parachlorella kessleri]
MLDFCDNCLPPSLHRLDITIGWNASGSDRLIPLLASAAAAVTVLGSLNVSVAKPQQWEGLHVDLSSLRDPWAAQLTQLCLSLPAKNVDIAPLAVLTNLHVLGLLLDKEVTVGQAAGSSWQHPMDGLTQLRELQLGAFGFVLRLGCLDPLPLARFPRLEVLNLAGAYFPQKALNWLEECSAYHLTLSLDSTAGLVHDVQLPTVTLFTVDATDVMSIAVRTDVALETLEALPLMLPNLQKVEWVLPSKVPIAAVKHHRHMRRLLMDRKLPQSELVVLVEPDTSIQLPDEGNFLAPAFVEV